MSRDPGFRSTWSNWVIITMLVSCLCRFIFFAVNDTTSFYELTHFKILPSIQQTQVLTVMLRNYSECDSWTSAKLQHKNLTRTPIQLPSMENGRAENPCGVERCLVKRKQPACAYRVASRKGRGDRQQFVLATRFLTKNVSIATWTLYFLHHIVAPNVKRKIFVAYLEHWW
jgi:hypothetical protein